MNGIKTIILAPRLSGKSFFMSLYSFKYQDTSLVCGEWLSTSNNVINGIVSGCWSAAVPFSHVLYRSWSDIYKIGVKLFAKPTKDNEALIYNSSDHIPYLLKRYPEIKIKIVLPPKDIHRQRWLGRFENEEFYQQKLIDVMKNNETDWCLFNETLNWPYIEQERYEYERLGEQYEIPIYETFEEAL